VKHKAAARPGIELGTPDFKPSVLTTTISLHPPLKDAYHFIDDTEERHTGTENGKFKESDSVFNSGSWEITIIIHLSHIQKGKSARSHLPGKRCHFTRQRLWGWQDSWSVTGAFGSQIMSHDHYILVSPYSHFEYELLMEIPCSTEHI